MGHLNRCLALADALRATGHTCRFACRALPNHLNAAVRDEGFPLDELPAVGEEWPVLERLQAEHRYAAAVLDNYDFDLAYYRRAHALFGRTLVIDDIAHADGYAGDLLLNQNAGVTEVLYADKRTAGIRLLTGSDYVLLRPQFTVKPPRQEVPGRVTDILVTMGGGDSRRQTLVALRGLLSLPYQLHVVLGGAVTFAAEAEKLAATVPAGRVHLYRAICDMRAVMEQCQLAVCAGGSTCWELCYLGIPMLITLLDDNQRPGAAFLVQRGAADVLGCYEQVDAGQYAVAVQQIVDDRTHREAMRVAGMRIVDGGGAMQVAKALAA